MKTAIIIPARSGSKGITGKNLQRVGGRSLIRRCVLVCTAAEVGPVFVSTDDLEIAREAGVTAISRPPQLAGDDATSESALAHALQHEHLAGTEICVMVQCTSPWTQPDDIRRCVQAVRDGAGSAFAACRFHGYLWSMSSSVACAVGHTASTVRGGRQSERARFLEAGSVYAFRVGPFLKHPNRFTPPTRIVEVDAERVFEIDQPWQLERARGLA